MTDPTRSRTFSWQDPVANAQAGRTMPGIEFLRAMLRGDLPPPPIAQMMNFLIESIDDGRVVFVCTVAEYHYNPIGVVHGGLAATMLDSAMACAIQTKLPAGTFYTTVELSVNYLRPVLADTGVIRAIGTVIHAGRRMSLADGRLVDAAGKLYAHGKTTCMIMSE